jgi:hypothetical protein
MTAEHGGEAPQSHEPGYSPYGLAGQRVGELASILQVRLIAPGESLPYGPDETPRWTDEDRLAFGYLLEFEDSLPALAQTMGVQSASDSFPSLGVFGTAHPYGGYWDWIKSARDAAWCVTADEANELMKRGGSFPYEEQFIRLRREGYYTNGVTLAHMWTTWRRGLKPLDDPNFHEDVQETLSEITSELLPNGPRPHVIQ